MATTVELSRIGLRLVCDVSSLPVPRPKQVFPLPDLSKAAASFLTLALDNDSAAGKRGIKATIAALLPDGGFGTWQLAWKVLGADKINAVIVTAGSTVNVPNAMPSTDYAFYLQRGDTSDRMTVYPAATIATPSSYALGSAQDVAAAALAASNAASDALAANNGLAAIASDSILSPGEKSAVVLDYAAITGEQAGIDAQAVLFTCAAVDAAKAAYDAPGTGALPLLTAYLGILAGWNTLPGADVPIVGGTFRANFALVYSTRQTLLNAIAAQAKALADAAQKTGDHGNSVDWLTNAGKIKLIQDWAAEQLTQTALVAQAAATTPATSSTAYTNAVGAFSTAIIAAGAPANWATLWPNGTEWNKGGIMTSIQGWWGTIISARSDLQNAIAQVTVTKVTTVTTGVSAINSVDYLANIDKITLLRDWNAEQLTKAQFDAQASVAGVSSATYDNAVAALSTSLIAAGAPANWASIWPDGTTTGPITNVLGSLRTWWGTIATQRAALVNAIASTQAASAGASAVSLAASTAMQKANYTSDGQHIDGVNLAGGAVTAATMSNADSTNLIPNGTSELPTPSGGWQNGAWETACLVTGNAYNGTKCRSVTGGQPGITPRIQVAQGDQFYLRGQLKNIGGGVSYLVVYGFDAAGGSLGNVFTMSIPGSSYTQMASPFTVGTVAGVPVAFIQVCLYVTSGTGYFDDLYMSRVMVVGQLAAGSVVAGTAAFGSILSSNLVLANMDNLVPNPNSEAPIPPGGWPAGALEGVGLQVGGGLAYQGINCRVVTPADGIMTVTPKIPVTAGEVYYIEAVARSITTGPYYLYTGGWNADGSYFGNVDAVAGSSATYATLGKQVLVPSGVAFLTMFIYCPNGTGARFDNLLMRKAGDSNLLVDGTMTSQKVSANGFFTTNFATVSPAWSGVGAPTGIPTAGVWFGVGSTNPLLIGPGGAKVGIPLYGGTYGSYSLDAAAVLAINTVRSNYVVSSPPANPRFWYSGNNDTTTLGGAPNIARLTVTPTVWDTTTKVCWLDLALQPSAAADNLDAMRYATIQFYRQSAAGTIATLTAVGPVFKQPLSDRLYYNPGTDTDSGNSATVTACAVHSGFSSGYPAAIVTLYDAFGAGAGHCFYAGAGWTAGAALTDNGTSFPAGFTGGSGGGTGGGGGGGGGAGCVPAGTPLLLPDGTTIPIEQALVGLEVAAWDDVTLEAFPSTIVKTHTFNDRALWRIVTADGELVCSHDHRILQDGLWVPAREAKVGVPTLWRLPDGSVAYSTILAASPTGEIATVYHMSLAQGHVYCAGNLLAHNMKILN